MFNYAKKVMVDVERWREAGLIDAETAAALARDVEAQAHRGVSFGSVLAIMAGVLVAAALLIMVAANWEGIPRLGRVGALFSVIVAGYVGGAVLVRQGQRAFGEASWLVAASAFGGAIALIAQMYHMSGDETQAILVWFAGTLAAAVALRSGPLTAGAMLLACAWLLMRTQIFGVSRPVPHLFILLAAVTWAASLWTESRVSRYLILASGILYGLVYYVHSNLPPVLVGMAIIYGGLVVVAAFRPALTEKVLGVGAGGVSILGLLGFLVSMWTLHFLVDDIAGFVICAAATLAAIAAALVGAGSENRGLRWTAYGGFTVEVAIIYIKTVGTMIGTAGLFLASGVVLGLAAYLIIRVERRFAARRAEGAAA